TLSELKNGTCMGLLQKVTGLSLNNLHRPLDFHQGGPSLHLNPIKIRQINISL
uniref:Uncharacterized protein n=1 Tax=Aegilops tauschii subsp. strangulata TaxID=200361 RepID=A0A453L766_AEGTS